MGKKYKKFYFIKTKMADQEALRTALQKVLNAGLYKNLVARGLNESCKALEYDHTSEENKAALCILATDCEEEAYKKLITGLCKTWKVKLLTVEKRSDLGKWVGLYKTDSSDEARKIRPCSCVVLRKYPQNADLQQHINLIKAMS